MEDKITLSVIKADVGGFVGHSSIHEELLAVAKGDLEEALTQDLIVDFHVTACGDDLELIMSHRRGVDDDKIHGLAWEIFEACTSVAERLKLYGAVAAWVALGIHMYWITVAWAKQSFYLQSGVKCVPIAFGLNGAMVIFFLFSIWASWYLYKNRQLFA